MIAISLHLVDVASTQLAVKGILLAESYTTRATNPEAPAATTLCTIQQKGNELVGAYEITDAP